MAHAQKTGLLPPQHHAPKKRIDQEATGGRSAFAHAAIKNASGAPIENSKNAPFRTDKILTFVPSIRPFAGESRPRFRMELNEELEGGIFSSNALMSTSAALHAGGLIVGKSSPRAFGSERGSKV